jgi:hypothetical protein
LEEKFFRSQNKVSGPVQVSKKIILVFKAARLAREGLKKTQKSQRDRILITAIVIGKTKEQKIEYPPPGSQSSAQKITPVTPAENIR